MRVVSCFVFRVEVAVSDRKESFCWFKIGVILLYGDIVWACHDDSKLIL